ncbi:MAG: AI-2E family transporter [Deltaproteobacteria bacterium]|nr:AI-2E family transporter [Deltaproteobacteria bacterium]
MQLWTVVVVITVALVIAGTLNPMVTWLERRGLKRGPGLLLIFLLLLIILAGLLLLTIPPLASQLMRIIDDAPRMRTRAINWLNQYAITTPLANSIKSMPVNEMMKTAGDHLLGYSQDVMSAIGYGITTMFLAFYLLADSKRATGAVYALVPRAYHLRLARILMELEHIVGGYMRGQLITSAAITVFTFGLLSAFKVDNALALAIFAGLTDVIPFVGGIIASAPAVLGAAGQSGTVAVVVLIAMFVYQEFETRILVPRIYGRVLRLSPAVVLVALLIGGTLLGILGALLALPIAAGLQMIVRELRVELPGEGTPDVQVRARDEKAEAVYEALTAGAPAEQAAVIASELAHAIKDTEAHGASVTQELPTVVATITAREEAREEAREGAREIAREDARDEAREEASSSDPPKDG